MAIDAITIYKTKSGKVYQNKEDAENFQKIEDFKFDYEYLPAFHYITIHFEYPYGIDAMNSGKFIEDMDQLTKLYKSIFIGKDKPEIPEMPKVKLRFYDRIAKAIYLLITGNV